MKICTVLASATLLLAGCQTSSKPAAAPGMINGTCPFSSQPVGEGAPTAEWNGDTVGFCCAGCAMRWDGWTDEQKDAFVSAQ
ncbi:MAG: hypothetical protein QF733_00175 [Phycisphaerales bacterium]|jgi:hypothetical protein|nr:hypothetical protein [Phycisphaerales bacterium]